MNHPVPQNPPYHQPGQMPDGQMPPGRGPYPAAPGQGQYPGPPPPPGQQQGQYPPPPPGQPPGPMPAAQGHPQPPAAGPYAPPTADQQRDLSEPPSGTMLPGEPVPPPPDAGTSESSGTQAQWRRLHRVTPLLNAWKVGAAIFFIALYNFRDGFVNRPDGFPGVALLGIIVGLLVVGFIIGLVASYLGWHRTAYGVSPESVFLHKGVLFRQQRHVRLDRVQAIEVTQPLLARIFGFASLKVESAGGAASNLTLAYLTESDAQSVRSELLARAAGLKIGSSPSAAQSSSGQPGTPAPTVAPEAPEREIASLSAGRLMGSLALSLSIALAIVFCVVLLAVAAITRNPGLLVGFVAPLLGAAGFLWSRFAGEFNFRVAYSPDGIRLRHGLLETKARTVPPGRVQAVRISQPPLWRITGWWRIQVNIAGYGPEEVSGTVLYPAASRDEVAFMLSLVLPDLGDERPLEVLAAGLDGIGESEGYTTSPHRARWLDPLTWRRTAFRITNTAILLRSGRLWRALIVVPHERTQSLGLTQGPLERKLDLASFVVHSTPGPVVPTLKHQDLRVALQLLDDQADRSRQARMQAGPERWMSEVDVTDGSDLNAIGAEAARAAYSGLLPGRTSRTAGILPTRNPVGSPDEG